MAESNTPTTAPEENPSPNQNDSNESEYTKRQILSSFQPSLNAHLQQLQSAPEQQVVEQFQSLELGQEEKSNPQSPKNSEVLCNGVASEQSGENSEATLANALQGKTTISLSVDATVFSPSPAVSAPSEPKITAVANDRENAEVTGTRTSALIFDLSKYKHDYFISNLTCDFDRDNARFNSPTGITALPDDRLVVANYDRDCLFLLDIKGRVHKIYQKIPAPKDVIHLSSTPSRVVIAAKKELMILDLETGQIVAQSKLRGFYPWNVQYLEHANIFAACDPSGERIAYFDKDLVEVGNWSLNSQAQHLANNPQSQPYQKTYPYAARFMPDGTAVVFTHVGTETRLSEYDVPTTALTRQYRTPPSMQSYSVFVDSARKYLLADKPNHRLACFKPDGSMEEFRRKSIQEPYSMAFLSTGTLCVTCWNKSYGTNGGISINSEVSLENQS